MHDAMDVDVQRRFPARRRDFPDIADGLDTRIVDQQANRAMPVEHVLRQRVERFGLWHVQLDRFRLAASCHDLGGNLVGAALVDVGDDDGHADLAAAAGKAHADASARAGNDGDAARKDLFFFSHVHASPKTSKLLDRAQSRRRSRQIMVIIASRPAAIDRKFSAADVAGLVRTEE